MPYLFCLLLVLTTAFAELKTDIEFAKVGDVTLTLDANIPDGAHGMDRWEKAHPEYTGNLIAWLL